MLQAVKNYFAITKKEWNGMLVLAIFLLVILFAPNIYRWLNPPAFVDFSRIKEASQILAEAKLDSSNYYQSNNYNKYKNTNTSFGKGKLRPQYFSFNPNHLPAEDWKKLGLSERQINVIKNYEAKGGKFFKKEDLQKIYSIAPEEYAGLESYINIPTKGFNRKFPAVSPPTFKSKPLDIVDINQADSAQLTEIKGIGPAFANRILKYRNRLGGFYNKSQLMEVFGLDSAKYAEIENQVKIDPSIISKININTCVFDDLKRNPYLNFKQMNAIIQYRKQHGNYASVKDLKNVAILTDEVLNKIGPYLIFDQR